MTGTEYISYLKIADHLDINKGDGIIIASDIIRLAMIAKRNREDFYSDSLIKSFQEKVTREGTILIPSYNHNLRSGDRFDIKRTRPITGAMALAALNNKDFVRTRHPLHSFLVWGKNAPFYSGLKNKSSFGEDSPFAFFKDQKLKMICVSVPVSEALTYVHYFEEMRKVKYRKYRTLKINYTDRDGKTRQTEFLIYAKKKGRTLNLKWLEEQFKKKGIIDQKQINGLTISVLPLAAAAGVISEEVFDNDARHIAYFDTRRYLKDIIKPYLYKLNLFRTTTDKIRYANYLL